MTGTKKYHAGKHTASCVQRASRWVGVVQGPTDLSTNPAHLDGFGRWTANLRSIAKTTGR